MCGRTACTLRRDQLCRACQYRNSSGQLRNARFVNVNPSYEGKSSMADNAASPTEDQLDVAAVSYDYRPRYNINPGSHCPVLINASQLKAVDDANVEESLGSQGVSDGDERLLTTMRWGLVPSWYKGDPNKIQYKMNNARGEEMTSKPMFKGALAKGRRCVVVVDGFFEWKPEKDGKQPYFIYFKENDGIDFSQAPSTSYGDDDLPLKTDGNENPEIKAEPSDQPSNDDTVDDDKVVQQWRGRRLLTMAGVYDVSYPSSDDIPLYSYAVVTIEASELFSWIHHRIPVILDGDEAVSRWLDAGNVPLEQAMKLVQPATNISWYKVDRVVGNVRAKGPECVRPLAIAAPCADGATKGKKKATLDNYFHPKKPKLN